MHPARVTRLSWVVFMIYLDTKMCGYDPYAIGFPSVETCMAIVVETTNGLIGWHASSGTDTFFAGAVKFGGYVERKRQGQAVVHVYGISHVHRFTESKKAKKEIIHQLRSVAAEVGLRAGSYAVLEGRAAELVEFRRTGANRLCDVFYAANTSVTYNKGQVSPSATKHRTLHPTQGDKPIKLYGGDDDRAPIVESVSLVNEGQGSHMLKLPGLTKFSC